MNDDVREYMEHGVHQAKLVKQHDALLDDEDATGGVVWLDEVKEEDYQSALRYLTILLDIDRAQRALDRLKKTPITTRRVNDVLRATHREPLPVSDIGVHRNMEGVKKGHKFGPLLVVSFSHGGDIADGYHRASAVYNINPFADVRCKLAHVPDLQHGRA
jgi:hypothetical protein